MKIQSCCNMAMSSDYELRCGGGGGGGSNWAVASAMVPTS